MRQFGKQAQDVQIRQLGEVVLREDQRGQVRYRGCERGLDAVDAVAGQEEGVQARREGEVGEGADVVVGEVDCVLVLCVATPVISIQEILSLVGEMGEFYGNLCNAEILNRGYFVPCGFSKLISMELIPKCSICSFQLCTHL